MTKSPTLAERLTILLAERKSLRLLAARMRPFLSLRSFTPEREALEAEIAAVVTESLPFTDEERRHNIPQARHLAEAAFRLPLILSRPDFVGSAGEAWNNSGPVSGISTDSWHPLIKQRLLDLCSTLDDTLRRMLAE